jgi:hypothetical protein
VLRKKLVDEEGVWIRLSSPNLRRALVHTGITIDQLRQNR